MTAYHQKATAGEEEPRFQACTSSKTVSQKDKAEHLKKERYGYLPSLL